MHATWRHTSMTSQAGAALQIHDRSPESRPVASLNQSQTQMTRPVLECNAPRVVDCDVIEVWRPKLDIPRHNSVTVFTDEVPVLKLVVSRNFLSCRNFEKRPKIRVFRKLGSKCKISFSGSSKGTSLCETTSFDVSVDRQYRRSGLMVKLHLFDLLWICFGLVVDLSWICCTTFRLVVDLLWTCCTACCTTNPQQIE